MNDMTGGHTVSAYNDELKHINELVEQLGGLGRDQLQRAVQSLREGDTKAAGQVIDRDRDLNDIDGHAKNIAGHVIYLMTARDVRHESLATIREEVLASKPN